jgi:hypothetical protein
MALKLRRGIEAERLGITPAEGELLYVTDHVSQEVSPLWVGDGTTVGGNPVSVSNVISVNGKDGALTLNTDDIDEGLTPTNLWFTNDRAKDAAGAALTGGTHTGVSFTYDTEAKTISAAISAAGIVNSGQAYELGFYSENGSTISSTGAGLTWNNVTSVLNAKDGTLRVESENGARTAIVVDGSHNDDANTSLSVRRSRGTLLAPTAVQPGDVLTSIFIQGHDGTNYVNSASISVRATGTVSTNTVPSTITILSTGEDGVLSPRVRITDQSRVVIGPLAEGETGSGRIEIRQVVSSNPTAGGEAVLAMRNTFSDAFPAQIALAKVRGTPQAPLAVQQADNIGEIRMFGFDGTSNVASSIIRGFVSGPVSTGKVPGGISFGVVNPAGVMTITTRINSTSMTHVGDIVVTDGTVTATEFISTGTGTPALESATNLDLSAATAVRIIGGGTFRLPQLTTAQRDDIARVPANGDMIYNTTDNKVQAYQNGAWINLDGTV